jgi:hypothetical protein
MQAKRDEAKARLWAERIAAFERSGLGCGSHCGYHHTAYNAVRIAITPRAPRLKAGEVR